MLGEILMCVCACVHKLAINLIAALIVARVLADFLAQVLLSCRRVQAEPPTKPFIPYLHRWRFVGGKTGLVKHTHRRTPTQFNNVVVVVVVSVVHV